jgi:hypothetical protein
VTADFQEGTAALARAPLQVNRASPVRGSLLRGTLFVIGVVRNYDLIRNIEGPRGLRKLRGLLGRQKPKAHGKAKRPGRARN